MEIMEQTGFEALKNDVREIKDALLGCGMHQKKGLMQRQDNIEKRVTIIERLLWIATGVVIIISIILKA